MPVLRDKIEGLHSSLVFGEDFVLKDLFFYEVTHLADSETHQDSLEEQERKC